MDSYTWVETKQKQPFKKHTATKQQQNQTKNN